MDRILPTDEHGPGALDAGANRYVAALLPDRLVPSSRTALLGGLDLVDGMARQVHGRPFADCSPEARDELLHKVAQVPHALPRRFLRILVELTLRGFLADPRHGGNRDGIGWRLIGFDPSPRNPP